MAISSQKLLGGSTESRPKNTKFLAKVSKSNLSVARRFNPGKLVETPKAVSSRKQKSADLVKLNIVIDSLVKSTNSLKKTVKKDSQDQTKVNKDRKRKKEDLQTQKREEKAETKKVKAQVTKNTELPKVPDFFKDIIGTLGRFTLSVGIMRLLKFITDTDGGDSLFGFLEKNIDTITIGFLGIMGALFVSSFLPVISLVGTIFSIFSPIIIGIGSFLLQPMILGPVLVAVATIAATAGTTAPGTLNESALDKRLAPDARIVTIESIYGGIPLSEWPPQVILQYEKDIKSEGLQWKDVIPRLTEMQKKFEQDSQDIIDKQSKPQAPQAPQAPQVQPQTPMMGDTKLGGAYGTGLKTGPSQYIGGSTEYHIDTKLSSDLSMEEIVGMVDQMARAYITEGREMEFSNNVMKGKVYNPDDSYEEKSAFLMKAFKAHNLPRGRELDQGGFYAMDYFINDIGKTADHSSAEGAEIIVPVPEGGSLEYHSGPRYGNFVVILDKDGNVVGKTGHGDTRFGKKSGTVQFSEQKPKGPNVSSTTSYEEKETQIALLKVPVSTPSGGGGGSRSSSGNSGSGDGVNINMKDFIVALHYREA